MLDKPKGLWYYKVVDKRPSLSLNQAVGVGRPELMPLERSEILNEGGSLQAGGGHAGLLWGFLVGGGHAGLGLGCHDVVISGIFFLNELA